MAGKTRSNHAGEQTDGDGCLVTSRFGSSDIMAIHMDSGIVLIVNCTMTIPSKRH